jgi:hypothetical protein
MRLRAICLKGITPFLAKVLELLKADCIEIMRIVLVGWLICHNEAGENASATPNGNCKLPPEGTMVMSQQIGRRASNFRNLVEAEEFSVFPFLILSAFSCA